jgi:UDP-glucose 4-epimerase
VLNSGTGVETSIGSLVKLICEVVGKDVEVVEEEARLRPSGSEVMRLVADSSKLRAATGWKPAVELREGLMRAASWFGDPANLARYKSTKYTI